MKTLRFKFHNEWAEWKAGYEIALVVFAHYQMEEADLEFIIGPRLDILGTLFLGLWYHRLETTFLVPTVDDEDFLVNKHHLAIAIFGFSFHVRWGI